MMNGVANDVRLRPADTLRAYQRGLSE
jgi:hypothetical protein